MLQKVRGGETPVLREKLQEINFFAGVVVAARLVCTRTGTSICMYLLHPEFRRSAICPYVVRTGAVCAFTQSLVARPGSVPVCPISGGTGQCLCPVAGGTGPADRSLRVTHLCRRWSVSVSEFGSGPAPTDCTARHSDLSRYTLTTSSQQAGPAELMVTELTSCQSGQQEFYCTGLETTTPGTNKGGLLHQTGTANLGLSGATQD